MNKKVYHHWEVGTSTLTKTLPRSGVSKLGGSRQCSYWGAISIIFGMQVSLLVHSTTVM